MVDVDAISAVIENGISTEIAGIKSNVENLADDVSKTATDIETLSGAVDGLSGQTREYRISTLVENS